MTDEYLEGIMNRQFPAMTHQDVAGVIAERLRRLAKIARRALDTGKMVSVWSADPATLDEAAKALESQAKALSALEAERNTWDRRVAYDELKAREYENRATQQRQIDSLSARLADARRVIEPFAEMRVALDLIAADKPGEQLLDNRAVFQTWGLKGTPKAKQITLGHLRAARDFLNAKEKT